MVDLINSEIITQGPWIINSTNRQRIHLKCANWYGAHQELYVVGGLEIRSIAHLADSLKASGANCVRLPYSIEMVKYNPVVRRDAVAGILPSDQCNSTDRAMDVLDCVVQHLQKRNILIILNNHNSWAGWVGAGAEIQQGLWNMPGYSTEDWIWSMEYLVSRYKVAGVDFRNEIHDQSGVKITWGESDNINTDWLAASTAAYERLYKVDPEILAIVGGLCWNLDLRAMAKNVGPVRAFNNNKLVYTVHLYTFSFWWRVNDDFIIQILTPASFWLFVVLFVLSVICLYVYHTSKVIVRNSANLYEKLEAVDNKGEESRYICVNSVIAFFSTSLVFHIGWLVLALIYHDATSSKAGCSTLSNDAVWLITLASLLVACSGVCLLCCCCEIPLILCIGYFILWLGLFCFSVSVAGSYLSTNAAILDFLNLWSLNDRPVPVMVGEFGTGKPSDKDFTFIWNYIHQQYDLDFAYWALNGRVWKHGKWESESFGLFNDAYDQWRHPDFISKLFQ